MSVGVSLVSYNTKDLLVDLINALQTAKLKNDLEIWVVDNSSTDGSTEELDKIKDIKLLKNIKNLGFAKAQNQILKQLKTDYALVLNPDTKFDPKDIDKMIFYMEENPSCGISSCKLVGFDGKLQSNGGDLPYGLALISWLFNLESFGIKQNFHRSDYIEKEVGWVGGTFMMVKKEVFESIGYLDEDYFMYFEDTEFCIRAREAGFKVMINKDVVIKHKSGASSENPHLNQWTGEFKGLIKFYIKRYGRLQGFIVRHYICVALYLRISVFFLLGRFKTAKTYSRVLWNVLF